MYQLIISEKQAQVISQALEIFARLGIGQFRDALEVLPLEAKRDGWHETLGQVGELLSRFTKGNVNGRGSSWSIHVKQVSEESRISYDLHQVIRYRLAWDKAIKDGIAENEHSPRSRTTFLVSFDEPFQVGAEPLANMKKE